MSKELGLNEAEMAESMRQGFIRSLSQPNPEATRWADALKYGLDGRELAAAESAALTNLINNHFAAAIRHAILENNARIAEQLARRTSSDHQG